MKHWFNIVPNKILIALIILLVPMQNRADDDLDRQQKALKIISDFADKLCKDVPIRGDTTRIELTGDAKTELKGIVSKVAELGFGGAAKYTTSSYEGLLQTDLVPMLNSKRNCNLQIWKDLKDKLLTSVSVSPSDTFPSATTLVEGTDISIGILRNDIDKQLARIGSTCNWGLNSENAVECKFQYIRAGLPVSASASFKKDRLHKLIFSSSFSWNENFYPKKQYVRGNKQEYEKYCSQNFVNQHKSLLIGKYGEPVSPPQLGSQDISADLYKRECENNSSHGECGISGTFEYEKYVFRVSDTVLLQFIWNKKSWAKISAKHSVNDETCVFEQSFVEA